MKRTLLLGLLIITIGLFIELISGSFALMAVSLIIIWSIAAMGMVLLIGFTGQLSLGHSAFVAIGAYSSAMVTTQLGGGIILGFLTGIIISALFGLVIGLPALRLKGYYLAIATIAFGVGMEQLINATNALGGPQGIRSIPPFFRGISADRYTFFLVTAIFLLFYAVGLVIIKSPVAIKFRMIRDSEVAARSYGTELVKNKLLVFVISAIFCSITGSLYAHTVNLIQPLDFGLMVSINLLLMIIIGGAIMLEGGLIGAVIITGIPFLLSRAPIPMSLINGILLIVFVLLLPKGISFEIYLAYNKYLQIPYIKIMRFIHQRKKVKGSFVTTSLGKKMFYVEQGQGEPLLLLHGNTGSHMWFQEVMDIPGYRCIAPDMVNFGRSDRLDNSEIESYTKHLLSFLDAINVESVYLAAHSLGGAVALNLAIEHPNRVRRLFLLDGCPIDGLKTPEEFYPVIETLKKNYTVLSKSIGGAMGTRKKDKKLVRKLCKEALLMNEESFVGNARALSKIDFRDKAADFTIPNLFVVGKKDHVISVKDAERTAACLKGEVKVIEHVGHSLVVEDPELFKKLVFEFDSK